MGVFDYKDYTSEEAAELADLSHQISAYGQLRSILTLPIGEILEGFDNFLGEGVMTGSDVDVSAPDGWSLLDPAILGISPDMVDADGYIKLVSPLTGTLEGGPQLDVLIETDASGAVTGLAINFIGTNSLLDVIDYTQLNSGEMAAAMNDTLELIRDYAVANGIAAEDIIVTGYSLGAGYTNVMARFADTLADGFFADSNYIGHAVPVIFDDSDRVLNVGYENDVIHRAAGDETSFLDALAAADPLLSNNDKDFETSTDNIVLFDGVYANAELLLSVDSILNLFGWYGHGAGMLTDATARIGNSVFYEFTDRDSAIIVSNLGADLRPTTWVKDKAAPTSDHFGAPAFIIGTEYADLLGDGAGNDWLEGLGGDDKFSVSSGLNRIDGGDGTDTVRLMGHPEDYRAFKLADGSFAFLSKDGLTLATNIEDVEITHKGPLGLVDYTTPYTIKGDRLEDDSYSLFEWGDEDIKLESAREGTAGNDVLSGSIVFSHAGDDTLTGTKAADILHGGEGEDLLIGGAGADRLYGAEHDDRLVGTAGDRLNGGHGDDVFVFNTDASGRIVIEDFNQADDEGDMIEIAGATYDEIIAGAVQSGEDLVLEWADVTLVLENTDMADLSADQFVFV